MSQRRELPSEVSNMIRTGVVLAVQTSPPRLRVRTGEIETDWIRWGERRAGAGIRTWEPPSIGEQVVLLCPEGDLAQAVAVCAIYSDTHAAPASDADVQLTQYADGSIVEFNSQTSTLSVTVGSGNVVINCDTATVTATTAVELDTPKVRCSGAVEIEKTATVATAATGVFGTTTGQTVTVEKGIVTKIT